MDKRKKEEVEHQIVRNLLVEDAFRYLKNEILNKVINDGDIEKSMLEFPYKLYMKEIVDNTKFSDNVKEIIIDKTMIKPKEIMKCNINEVEKDMKIKNDKFQVFNTLLGKIFNYKLENTDD